MLYKVTEISNLKEIQQEVLIELEKQFSGICNIKNGFHAADTSRLKQTCPNLETFLRNKNLFDRWVDTGLSFLNQSELPVHSDSFVKNRKYALNIPIMNCENSYTIWYEPKDNAIPKADLYKSSGYYVISLHYKKELVNEIDRLDSSIPAFVNIKQPHSGINLSNQPRCLISLRFRSELTEEEINFL